MADKLVEVGLKGNTITLSMDPIIAERGTKPTITWTAENEPNIDRIDKVFIHDWKTPQPQEVTPKVWTVLDPNGSRKTHKYDVAVIHKGSGRRISLDPEIENMGQNGDDDEPSKGKGGSGGKGKKSSRR